MTGSDGQPCDGVCASLGCTDGCNTDGPGVPTPVTGSDGQQEREATISTAEAVQFREFGPWHAVDNPTHNTETTRCGLDPIKAERMWFRWSEFGESERCRRCHTSPAEAYWVAEDNKARAQGYEDGARDGEIENAQTGPDDTEAPYEQGYREGWAWVRDAKGYAP